MPQSVVGSMDALYAVLQQLYATPNTSVVVVLGDPGVYQADLIVSLLEMREPRTRPTAGPGRSRDLMVEIDVLFSQFAAGGDEVQKTVVDLAHAAADQLEAYFRVGGNEKLSGNCYDAFVSTASVRPYVVWSEEKLGDGSTISVAVGRACDITDTVTVRVRI